MFVSHVVDKEKQYTKTFNVISETLHVKSAVTIRGLNYIFQRVTPIVPGVRITARESVTAVIASRVSAMIRKTKSAWVS